MVRVSVKKTKAEAKKIVSQKNRMISKSPFPSDKKFSFSYQKIKKGYGIYKNKK